MSACVTAQQPVISEEIEEELFVQGSGIEVLQAWRAKEAKCVARISGLDATLRRHALRNLVGLVDNFVMLLLASARSAGKHERIDVNMERIDAASLAVAIFQQLDDSVLLGGLEPVGQPALQELHCSCWALAWLSVKTTSGMAFTEVSIQGNCPKAPQGTSERELEILRALGYSAWCPSLFSWTGLFRTRLLALQGSAAGERVTNVFMASLTMAWALLMSSGESQRVLPQQLAGGMFYMALEQVCTKERGGVSQPLAQEEIEALIWVTDLSVETMQEGARVVSAELMASAVTARQKNA